MGLNMDIRMDNAILSLDQTIGGEVARVRRKHLLEFLYHQRYLTRKGLSWRLERTLGSDCSWWESSLLVFILDIWFVRKVFLAAGYKLGYSWKGERKGFYLRGEGEVSQELSIVISGAVSKVDPAQVEITRRLSPAQRVQQGLSLTDLAHKVVRYRKAIDKRYSNERT
jgi:hypothetical protein